MPRPGIMSRTTRSGHSFQTSNVSGPRLARSCALSDMPEDPWLIALGSAVSDGADIDWDKAERETSDESKKQILRQLRGLATIVHAHRSDGLNPSDSAPAQTPSSRHWRHIVLFEVIGSGAFGTVYRGWDPTLDRDVAVKLLRLTNGSATSPLEEARHLARIRHTNVVTVYGADREGDEAGIWMEYIEGHTLARMVSDTGPLSARETTGVGVDLCRALAALHGAGLLHRDIKAQNVIREIGGRIVLMDLSGARAIHPDAREMVMSGTPLYMAPEVLTHGAATVASDVYSLGVLLFFLLSAGLPAEGDTVAELKEAHAEGRRRRLRDMRPDVPDAIVQVIEHAIAPDASNRYQTAGEFEHALIAASGSHAIVRTEGAAAAARASRATQVWSWIAVAALVVTILSVTIATSLPSRAASPRPLITHFTIGPPFTSGSWPRVSPDGRFVAFGAIVEGRDRFWIRPLDAVSGWPLMNTIANESPFWSPDGSTLCFFADGKLKRIPVASGNAQPEILAEAPTPHGGDWNGQSIVFARDGGIFRIPAALEQRATVSQLTKIDTSLGEYQHAWPAFLPDGRRFLFVIRSKLPDRTGIYLGSIDGDTPRLVMPASSRVKYTDGHVLFVRQGILVAQRFNVNTATVEGSPFTLTDRIKYHTSADAAFDASTTGVLVYGQSAGEPITRLMVFDGRGREMEPLTPPGAYRHPRFSPDGHRVVAEKVNADDGNVDLWVYDLERRSVGRLTSAAAADARPVWSADGTRVAFSSKRGSVFDVYAKSVDSTDPERPLITGPGDKLVEHWSADGKYLSGTVLRSGLWVYPIDPSEKPWMVRASQTIENWQSEFSPDGKWLAYMSRESGNPEVFVEPIPATGARWQVSTHGGAQPHWRTQGRELLYLSTDGLLMAVPVTAGEFQKSSPMALFHISVPDLIGSGDYTISPDGKRIVVNTFISDPVIPPIDVVVNWPVLLKR
jgi:serine/threonine protein kinase